MISLECAQIASSKHPKALGVWFGSVGVRTQLQPLGLPRAAIGHIDGERISELTTVEIHPNVIPSIRVIHLGAINMEVEVVVHRTDAHLLGVRSCIGCHGGELQHGLHCGEGEEALETKRELHIVALLNGGFLTHRIAEHIIGGQVFGEGDIFGAAHLEHRVGGSARKTPIKAIRIRVAERSCCSILEKDVGRTLHIDFFRSGQSADRDTSRDCHCYLTISK
jgi:hypothetical protein